MRFTTKHVVQPLSLLLQLFVVVGLSAICGGCDSQTQQTQIASPGESIETTESIPSLRRELSSQVENTDLRLKLAQAYLRNGDGAEAESHFRRVLKQKSGDPSVSMDLARSLLLQHKQQQVIELVIIYQPKASPVDEAWWWAIKGEAQLMFKNRDQPQVQYSFMQAYRLALQNDANGVLAHLKKLSGDHPLIVTAQAHVECKNWPTTLIEPLPEPQELASGRILQVGPGRDLSVPSQAARIAKDGDLVEIDAGQYRGDVAVWPQHNLLIRGVGGIAWLNAANRHAKGMAIWVFDGDNVTVENIGFSGAKVPNRNGAGIRLHGSGAIIRNCHFEQNENGILEGNIPGSDVLVEFSSFIGNGYGDGQSHNIYIGRVRSFTLRYSYSQGAKVGHLVKSRAAENAILYNRIIDGEGGNSSYVINLPEGGRAWIVGNELQQGPASQNPMMISFGEESAERDNQLLIVANNTMYNHVLDGTFVRNGADIDAKVVNNILAGAPALAVRGRGQEFNNLRRPGSWFVDSTQFDYSLTTQAPAIDAGLDPKQIENLKYLPTSEYRHPASGQVRKVVGAIDIGAREYCDP